MINLAPHGVENALVDEESSVLNAGMEYINIPVNFVRPTDRDVNQFAQLMNSLDDKKVWVHCAANMRVSAFMYSNGCKHRDRARCFLALPLYEEPKWIP